ncbi:MAG: hypothetical protein AB1497_04930 [Bacillota bacterium]
MFWFILLMVVIAVIEAPSLIRKRWWRELVVLALVWLLSTAYGVVVIADIPIPRPTRMITTFFQSLRLERYLPR